MKIQNHKFIKWIEISIILLILFTLPSQAQEKKQDRIVETVYVENIEVPVRVFTGNQPVGGLKKGDFEIYVDGEKKEINAFYEVKKKLPDNRSDKLPETETRPRLFVLIFNISDYHLNIVQQLDTLFAGIIRPGDHLVVTTNRYFFPEWTISEPEKTKKKIRDILEKEENRLKSDMVRFKNQLSSMAATFKSRISDPHERKAADFPAQIFRDFFMNYEFVLDDIKSDYFSIPLERYVNLAGYLKGLQSDKWVLNFYQLGRLPILDTFGDINKEVEYYLDSAQSSGGGGGGPSLAYSTNPRRAREIIQRFQSEFLTSLYQTDKKLTADISKVFLNSGATFHTLLMKPLSKTFFSMDFKFESISSDSENILKQLARLTGGSIVRSNRVEDFIKDITVKEDIIYMLTYVPDPGKKKNPKLEVKLANTDYRMVYDDQKRSQTLLKRIKDSVAAPGTGSLEIESMACSGNLLTVKLNNMGMARYEDKSFGAVKARIKVMDTRSKLIAGFEKTYKGIKEQGVFQAQLPPLAAGKYKVVLEVKDLFSLNNIYVGDAIYFLKK